MDEADKDIPADIKCLDGKKVVIRGFMLPLKVENEKATEFLIMRNQGACCFGTMPKMPQPGRRQGAKTLVLRKHASQLAFLLSRMWQNLLLLCHIFHFPSELMWLTNVGR